MKTIETNLFIGGVKDGRRDEIISDFDYLAFGSFPSIPVEAMDADLTVDMEVIKSVYRREHLLANQTRYAVWIEQSLSRDDALVLMLENYRPMTTGGDSR